jgi:hypothetical protein
MLSAIGPKQTHFKRFNDLTNAIIIKQDLLKFILLLKTI